MLDFIEYPAPAQVSDLIECFWLVSEDQRIMLFPDGIRNVIIGEVEIEGASELPPNFSGVLDLGLLKSIRVLHSCSPLIVVRLKAFALPNSRKSAPFEVFKQDSLIQIRKGFNSNQASKSIYELSDFYASNYQRLPILTQIINEILWSRGQVALSELYREWNLSRQSMAKSYAAKLGLSFKQLSTIWRLNDFLVHLSKSPNISSAFLMAGFFDQSHGAKSFQKYFNASPSHFLSEQAEVLPSLLLSIQRRFQGQYDPVKG